MSLFLFLGTFSLGAFKFLVGFEMWIDGGESLLQG